MRFKQAILKNKIINDKYILGVRYMKGYYVYKHTFPNGKVYIGITCQNSKVRRELNGAQRKNVKVY